MRPENRERLRTLGLVVHLHASEEILFARATRDDVRPLLQTTNPRASFATLLGERVPRYRALADFSVDTSALPPDEVAAEILQHLDVSR